MSDEKGKVSDKAGEIAKNVWLAGVGAYGKAVEDAQGRLEKAMEPPKLFRDLVKAGTALEEDARQAIDDSTTSARNSVEERISRVRDNFHQQRPARIEDLTELNKKVDKLTRKVEQLSKALAAQAKTKTKTKTKPLAKKKAAAKKPAAKKAPSAKKPAARKKSTSSKRKA